MSIFLIAAGALLSLVLPIIFPRPKQCILLHIANWRYKTSDPPLRRSKDLLFGLDIVLSDISDVKANRRSRVLQQRLDNYGKTFESYPFGRRSIATIDPRNVQFVLATGFENFGVGPAREVAMQPMVGRGVIDTDGAEWKQVRDLLMLVIIRAGFTDRELIEKYFETVKATADGRKYSGPEAFVR